MATTPKTVRTYPINSVTKDFTIPFEYLARKFVVVTLIGATRRELILNTEYRFTTTTTITTTKAWGPSDGFDLIEIRRLTSASERLVDFADGSILRAYDLNISSVQSLHIAEEARDLTADTIGVNNDGNLDARARRIVNVADAIDDGDAVNLRMQRTWAATALGYAEAAGISAGQAAQSASNAATAAGQANGSAQASATSAGQSAGYRDTALTYRNDALYAKSEAEGWGVVSQAWASTPEDTVVSGGLYSSLHYSRKSAASAVTSGQSATAAAQSAITAGQQAATAATEANRSKTEADRAKSIADGLTFPAIGTGDALKVLRVKSDRTGYELVRVSPGPIMNVRWVPTRGAMHPDELALDGLSLLRADYPDLYAAMDANWPSTLESSWTGNAGDRARFTRGNGTTTFRLPDLNGKFAGSYAALFLRGDGALTTGVAGDMHTSQNQSHSHGVNDPGHAHVTTLQVGVGGPTFDPNIINTSLDHGVGPVDRSTSFNATGISIQASGGSEARPWAAIGVWVIKARH